MLFFEQKSTRSNKVILGPPLWVLFFSFLALVEAGMGADAPMVWSSWVCGRGPVKEYALMDVLRLDPPTLLMGSPPASAETAPSPRLGAAAASGSNVALFRKSLR